MPKQNNAANSLLESAIELYATNATLGFTLDDQARFFGITGNFATARDLRSALMRIATDLDLQLRVLAQGEIMSLVAESARYPEDQVALLNTRPRCFKGSSIREMLMSYEIAKLGDVKMYLTKLTA